VDADRQFLVDWGSDGGRKRGCLGEAELGE
jgi:hypothetical protein